MAEIEAFYGLLDEQDDDWDEMLQEQLSRVAGEEFSTALSQAWHYNQTF